MNLSIEEKDDFTNVIEELQANPLTIPIYNLDGNNLDVNKESESDSESETISITPKNRKSKKERTVIDLGEIPVLISANIKSEKRIKKILNQEGKRVASALKKASKGASNLLLKASKEDSSGSDDGRESSLTVIGKTRMQHICLLKNEIERELGYVAAGINHGERAKQIIEKAIKGDNSWEQELLELIPTKYLEISRKIRQIIKRGLIKEYSSIPDESIEIEDDDDDSVDSSESISVDPDIPIKYTERQLVVYPETTNDPIKIPSKKSIKCKARSFGFDYEYILMGEPVYPNQIETAAKIVETFTNLQKVIQLIISRTQTGKTGCMINFISQYVENYEIPIENIFIISPMSSTDWVGLMKERCPASLEKRIYHLPKLNTQFRDDVEGKKNILILIDEAHCASLRNQTLHQLMSPSGLNWNLDTMMENDIKIVQFSATPDGLIYGLMKREWPEAHYEVHLMAQGNDYYGIKEMNARRDRTVLKQSKDLNGRNKFGIWLNEEKQEEVEEAVNELFSDMLSYKQPKYCIIRGRGLNVPYIIENLLSTADKYLRSTGQHNLFDWNIREYTQEGDIDVINELLCVNPKKHTFILIKEKLKCSHTIIKDHIGVVYVRLAQRVMDSFIIQGLLGRITGNIYHNIICYTNIDSLEKYERLFANNFSKEILSKESWISNSTKANKKGTKGKKTWVDQEYMIGEDDEEELPYKIWPLAGEPLFESQKDAENWFVANRSSFKIKYKRKSGFGLYNSDRIMYKSAKSVHDINNLYILYRSKLRKVVSEEATRKLKLGWGVKDTARIYPVLKNEEIRYIIVYMTAEEEEAKI